MDWRANLVDDDAGLARILREAGTIAVLGAKGETTQPAYYVPAYLKARGYRVLPVNPTRGGERILGEPVVATLADLRQPTDVVEVFRRTQFLPGSIFYTDTSTATTDGDRTGDQTASNVRFVLDKKELWFTSQDNGFQIVKFTNGVGLDASSGGGCSSGAGGSFGLFGAGIAWLLLRRRNARPAARD